MPDDLTDDTSRRCEESPAATAAAVRRLEDREAIRRLVHDYGVALDDRDFAGLDFAGVDFAGVAFAAGRPVDAPAVVPLAGRLGVALPLAGRTVFFTGSTPPTGVSGASAASLPPAAAGVVDFWGLRRVSPVLMDIGPRRGRCGDVAECFGCTAVGRVGPPPGTSLYPDSIGQ